MASTRILKHRPRWVCKLVGHRWERVGKMRGEQIVYAYHICWVCMGKRQFDGKVRS